MNNSLNVKNDEYNKIKINQFILYPKIRLKTLCYDIIIYNIFRERRCKIWILQKIVAMIIRM